MLVVGMRPEDYSVSWIPAAFRRRVDIVEKFGIWTYYISSDITTHHRDGSDYKTPGTYQINCDDGILRPHNDATKPPTECASMCNTKKAFVVLGPIFAGLSVLLTTAYGMRLYERLDLEVTSMTAKSTTSAAALLSTFCMTFVLVVVGTKRNADSPLVVDPTYGAQFGSNMGICAYEVTGTTDSTTNGIYNHHTNWGISFILCAIGAIFTFMSVGCAVVFPGTDV